MVAAPPEPSVSGKVDRATAFQFALSRHRQGKLDEAIDCYQRILVVSPDFAPAWINLGVALRAEGRIAASIACLRRGVALKPGDAAAHSNLGNALRAAGRLDEAAASHEAAMAIDPDTGSYRYNLALVQRDRGELDRALANFNLAEAKGYASAELKWDRALALLLKGDIERGFTEYDWRWQIPDATPRGLDAPAWDGGDLTGKTLLVYAEQGFGDTIQFVRYLPLVRTRPGAPDRIIFECPAPLARLFATSPAFDGISIAIRDAAPLPSHDAQVALLSLPRLAKTTPESIPSGIPYLATAGMPSAHPAPKGCQIGIAWAGKPTHRNDRNRSVALSILAPLFEVSGTTFHSLQLGANAEAIAAQGFTAILRDRSADIEDFADSAALLMSLDLVISVDTALVHLAGALGRPVWTLPPHALDWRWQTARTDSPWYPSMRLFRQGAPGDWQGVVGQVGAALREFAEGNQA
ncbi:MAG: tetratricopeptide repeat-containing glycosyltransferase family protein [Proteobacteria bacterium]|nr:tetratricopeptide repeat-containing glycosyltransferase family protein [Pseudomonadota bacterium]